MAILVTFIVIAFGLFWYASLKVASDDDDANGRG